MPHAKLKLADLKKRSITWIMRKEINRRAENCNSHLRLPTGDLSRAELEKLHRANIVEIEVAIKNSIDDAMYLLSQTAK